MLANSSRNRKLLAGVVGVNLSLALAVSAGAVPRPGDNGRVQTASVAPVEEVAAPVARQPGDTLAMPAAAPAEPAPPAAPVAPTTTVTKPRTTTPPTAKAATQAPTAAATAAAATPAAPAAPAKVARRTPSAAEVQSAISQLKSRVGGLLMLFSPTPAQIAQAGDQVCTAFDNGQTFAQVNATGLSMLPPSIVVTADTAEWAVRQAVTLYCPGHATKLV